MENIGKIVGQNIRKRREELKLSKSAIARGAKVTYNTVLRWEQGKTQPTPDNIRAVAEVLECDVRELLNQKIETAKKLNPQLALFLSKKSQKVQARILKALKALFP